MFFSHRKQNYPRFHHTVKAYKNPTLSPNYGTRTTGTWRYAKGHMVVRGKPHESMENNSNLYFYL